MSRSPREESKSRSMFRLGTFLKLSIIIYRKYLSGGIPGFFVFELPAVAPKIKVFKTSNEQLTTLKTELGTLLLCSC